jgi:very-short-patch-repair endonuclease
LSIERARELRKNMPPAEAVMWNALRLLRPMGFHFRRQVPVGRYYADFACHRSKLVIEVDGDTHGMSVGYDRERDDFVRGEGYRVLRIPNDEVMRNLDGVMRMIMLELGAMSDGAAPAAHPTLGPSPSRGGRRRGAPRPLVRGHR